MQNHPLYRLFLLLQLSEIIWPLKQILGGKIVKNVEIDPQKNGDMVDIDKLDVVCE